MKARIAIACAVVLAWAWLLAGGGVGMEEMDMGGGSTMLMRPEWTVSHASLVFAMWAVMMAAMMLPGASPAILRTAGAASDPAGGLSFAAGYLAVWSAFGLAATLAQFALDRSDLLSEAMALRSGALAGALVLAAGFWQLTPWKHAGLRRCARVAADRRGWRPRAFESARRGLHYGVYCLGCCWALMGLLFVAGVMNLPWVAAIALWVSAEKLLPQGARLARLAGAGLIAWGSALLAFAAL